MVVVHFNMHGKILLIILMACVMCLHVSMKRKIFFNMLMASVNCIHFSQLVDDHVTWACTS